jgi:hypothetical protein
MEEEIEAKHDMAVEIAIEVGVLKRCKIHEDVILEGGADIEDAYRLGNYKFTNGELEDAFRDRREMTDTIKEMVEMRGYGADECALCMK